MEDVPEWKLVKRKKPTYLERQERTLEPKRSVLWGRLKKKGGVGTQVWDPKKTGKKKLAAWVCAGGATGNTHEKSLCKSNKKGSSRGGEENMETSQVLWYQFWFWVPRAGENGRPKATRATGRT